MQVIVNVADRTVVVDGLPLRIEESAWPPTDATQIQWHGPDLVGAVAGGSAPGTFRDPRTVKPWLDAWQAEIGRRLDASHEAEATDLTRYEDWQEAEEARLAAEREAEAAQEARLEAFRAEQAAIAAAAEATAS
ncbi:hypothetical protein PQJ75_13765 [Rhodoplanes sp. TEM]|uniref:Phage tail protein n=1 Tax=Rhodoplanes tepidamans TaxID=200616 RepID=A0ABT5JEN1_RHOTP|nr:MULTISPECIES: hypothetical protein [Rhodoplanes]MDC7787958.1 hypothetical protein [Rhodoplanes tepidamans]MDC7984798.1 hypothetical protein [Rhodoplanes sp. TEM]MDQ0358387.1 hypothetical protein [Rhodoplanes tepidamans]